MGASTCTQSKENPSAEFFNTPEWFEILKHDEENKPEIIACRKEFVDMTEGDFTTAIMLDEIFFWHNPSMKLSNTKETKLGVFRDGKFWLARKNTDWEHKRLSKNQVAYSIKKLRDKGWIDTKVACTIKKCEKHTLIRLTEKFVQDLNRFRAEEQRGKFPVDTTIKGEISPLIPNANRMIPTWMGGKPEYSVFLYTSLFNSSLFEDTSLGECSPNSIRLRKEIGEKAKKVLLSWEQVHNPVALLKGYENLWAEYFDFALGEPTLVVGTEVGRLITYCHLLGMAPTPETCKRLEAIWNHFECDKITHPYGGAERSILLILLFVLRQKAPGWLPPDIEPENLDSVLWALLAYYEKHHEELEFPA